MVEITGGWFENAHVNEVLVVFIPSLTEMVICALPVAPTAGVTVTVRLAPLPPSAMLAFGTTAVLLEVAVTVRLEMDVSGSPIVNAMGPIAWLYVPVWFAIEEIVGG
jgi:hypothetical protein